MSDEGLLSRTMTNIASGLIGVTYFMTLLAMIFVVMTKTNSFSYTFKGTDLYLVQGFLAMNALILIYFISSRISKLRNGGNTFIEPESIYIQRGDNPPEEILSLPYEVGSFKKNGQPGWVIQILDEDSVYPEPPPEPVRRKRPNNRVSKKQSNRKKRRHSNEFY